MRNCVAVSIAVVVASLFVGSASASIDTYLLRASFDAEGVIAFTSDFDDFNDPLPGDGLSVLANPFVRGGITYNSGDNVVIDTSHSEDPVQNVIAYGGGSYGALSGSFNSPYNMFGFDAGHLTANSTFTVALQTNVNTYNFSVSLPAVNSGLAFFGFTTNASGEYFQTFSIQTQNDTLPEPESYAGLTNVSVGTLDVQATGTPEPASLAIWGLGALGVALAGRMRRRKV